MFEDTRRTTLITHQDGVTDAFLTTGRVLVEPGWQAVYGRKAGTSSKEELVPVRDGGAGPPCVRLKSATP